MVVAYGAFANGGFRVRPYSVERVENSRGVVIYENSGPKIVKVISFDTAAGMTYMLRKVVEAGTGRAANIAKAVAGKTGTTDDYRDAWFMGYNPDIVAGVWLGNDDNSKLPGITGGGLPARVWADYMKVAITNFADSVFDYPKLNGTEEEAPKEIKEVSEETLQDDDMNFEGFEAGDGQTNELQNHNSAPVVNIDTVQNPAKTEMQKPQRPFSVSEPPKPQTPPLPGSDTQSAPLPGM